MKIALPKSTQNWITLIGATIALISLSMIVFLFTVSLFWTEGHTYLGLVIYILLPSVMILGLFLIPIGMWIEVRRNKKNQVSNIPDWPVVNLNLERHRNAFIIFSLGTGILLFLSSVGSYEAFHYTESVAFCGRLCHSVMNPEYTAYQHSAHARVACVDCHVGEGAGWYVRSKLSGAYQVYAVLANVYPKPIETPIRNLRPARETCEQCHWPQKFYARQQRTETHYLGDEDNTQWDIQLIMKIGAERSAKGFSEGIHWHINSDVRIEYIARDEKRQDIPWVRYTNLKTGKQVIYQDEDDPLDESEIKPEAMRVMDCMDCHNRPSHDYKPPLTFINTAMAAGKIPVELPDIKYQAVELCNNEYSTQDSAMLAIKEGIENYYKENYPDISEEKPELITQAITGIQNAFNVNIFPGMKVRWSAYPNDIGHMNFNGCFRCHNDTHSSEDGEYVISRNCNQCHYISAQGKPGEMELAKAGESLEFHHPDDSDDWKESLCTDCHDGANP